MIEQGRLYFGSEDGTVYALNAANGAIVWTHKAGGAVKGALALDNGRLYFGDYNGQVTALRRADGKQLWKTGTSGGAFGLKSGNSTPHPRSPTAACTSATPTGSCTPSAPAAASSPGATRPAATSTPPRDLAGQRRHGLRRVLRWQVVCL